MLLWVEDGAWGMGDVTGHVLLQTKIWNIMSHVYCGRGGVMSQIMFTVTRYGCSCLYQAGMKNATGCVFCNQGKEYYSPDHCNQGRGKLQHMFAVARDGWCQMSCSLQPGTQNVTGHVYCCKGWCIYYRTCLLQRGMVYLGLGMGVKKKLFISPKRNHTL